ncbi:GNAT family N-acetyltransferase [Rhizobium sp. LCM 4573]|uniref:GNAT family N-acetyltransferase n=1 Tax=Rhizobium sp. LCM 4573 TaxID=1848291 RepID=UPI0008DA8911|nr:N-acetyltransferase [Rhizobium sp. LCM 4573]OHV81190.1 GNAT family N-acetyltransferase [Rhizobium sp. LCM 4573]
MIIRPENLGDEAAIHSVTELAFSGHPHSDGSEPLIVDRLRKAGALVLSLVADEGGEILGHVAFSRVEISDGVMDWYGMGPVSVHPQRQGEGIGSALIRKGLEELRAIGAAGCVVAGDPAYYGRFGFTRNDDLVLPDFPPDYFMALALHGPMASGIVAYHKAFYDDIA